MAQEHRIQARRHQIATGVAKTRDSAFSLPDDLLSEQVKRLALVCLIAAVLWPVGLLWALVGVPDASGVVVLVRPDADVPPGARLF